MLLTTLLTVLLATAGFTAAQNRICPTFPAEFTVGDETSTTYRIARDRNGTRRAVATTGDQEPSVFFVNPICTPFFNDVCSVPQLSYNETNCETGQVTTYGAYAPSNGGDLAFFVNGTDISGYSYITTGNSYDEVWPGACERLYLMGFLNKYLSVPRNCAGTLGLDRYFSNTTSGCTQVNVTYAAV